MAAMTVADLQLLFEYAKWADGRLFDVLSDLTTEEFTRSVAGSYGSVRGTMVHMISATWGWVGRCSGRERGPALVPEDYPTVASVRELWQKVEGIVGTFLDSLQESDVERLVTFQFPGQPTYALPLGEIMQHAVMHSVHHRGQVALLLRELGYIPGNFDFLFFVAEGRGPVATAEER